MSQKVKCSLHGVVAMNSYELKGMMDISLLTLNMEARIGGYDFNLCSRVKVCHTVRDIQKALATGKSSVVEKSR